MRNSKKAQEKDLPYCICHHSANFWKSHENRILDFLEDKEGAAGTFFDHMGAMFNGPKIKKERDKLLISNKLKDVLLDHASETSKAALENSEKMAAKDNDLFEERLRSEQQEKSRLLAVHKSQIQSIHAENGLKKTIELEYTSFLS